MNDLYFLQSIATVQIRNDNTQINDAVNSFLGEIEQIPPMFSAKKVNGKKLYELARKNKTIELKPSIINIYNINPGRFSGIFV